MCFENKRTGKDSEFRKKMGPLTTKPNFFKGSCNWNKNVFSIKISSFSNFSFQLLWHSFGCSPRKAPIYSDRPPPRVRLSVRLWIFEKKKNRTEILPAQKMICWRGSPLHKKKKDQFPIIMNNKRILFLSSCAKKMDGEGANKKAFDCWLPRE